MLVCKVVFSSIYFRPFWLKILFCFRSLWETRSKARANSYIPDHRLCFFTRSIAQDVFPQCNNMSSLFVSSRRAIIIVASLFIVVLFLSLHSSEQVSGKLSTWRMQIGQSVRRNETGLMPLRDAEAFCSSVGMEPWLERSLRRKVFDLTLINTELDWLEIRMGQLWDQVDYFVVVEATRTFTNKPKPLYVQEQLHRFERFYPKLIYHVLDVDKLKVDFGGLGSHKERERYQRNSNIDFVFPGLLGEQRPEAGDVLLVSGKLSLVPPILLLRN